ncbi:MAG: hypothetical protein ACTSRU_04820 [Candidatus Hodarchaeales archaeon]
MIEKALKVIVDLVNKHRGNKRIKILCINHVIIYDSQDGFLIQLRILISHVTSSFTSFSKEMVATMGENGVESIRPENDGRLVSKGKDQIKFKNYDKIIKQILDGFDE